MLRIVIGSAVCLLAIFGCGFGSPMTTIPQTSEVEVAPGRWLDVSMKHTVYASDYRIPGDNPHSLERSEARRQMSTNTEDSFKHSKLMEATRLSFEWDSKQVAWEGKEIPITLRELDGRLFMIGFNREDLQRQKTRLVFFEMSDDGSSFTQIPPNSFPRKIATQNMWITPNRYARTNEGIVDMLDLVKNFETDSRLFARTFTAKMWYQIETGTELYSMPSTIPQEFLEQYVKLYQPIPLPTVMKE